MPMRDDNDLLDFVAGIAGESFLKVEEDLGGGFVRLKISEAERRQAKHDIRAVEDIVVELLRNARDAGAHTIFVATTTERDTRSITIIDDGCGVPEGLRDRIFEPRVTSKLETMVIDDWGVHGRGMALYSIRQNVSRCDVVDSVVGGGTALAVEVDTATLRERADQSTWPKVKVVGGKKTAFMVESGPKNLIRHVVEFAIAHPEIDVYLGSPSEILSTMRRVNPPRGGGIPSRPSTAPTAADLFDVGAEIGLAVSERTAHRIYSGEVRVLPTVLEHLAYSLKSGGSAPDIYRDTRGLKVAPEDIAALQREVETAFESLAEKYYLALGESVRVSIGRNAIKVSVDFEKE